MSIFDKHKNSKNISRATDESFELPDMPPPIVSESTNPRLRAMIGPGIHIRGDIVGDENLTIDGVVEGSIIVENYELCIGSAGRITANVTAKLVRVEGEIKGDITGLEKVVVARTGNVRGNINAPRVCLEDGARFKGSIDMGPSDTAVPSLASLPGAVRAQQDKVVSSFKSA